MDMESANGQAIAEEKRNAEGAQPYDTREAPWEGDGIIPTYIVSVCIIHA